MYNCILNILLHDEDYSFTATTDVVVKVADAFKVFDKFFACFDMPLEHCTHCKQFSVECEVLPMTEFSEFAQLAEELRENNPFLLSSDDMRYVWHIVNDWKYSGCIKC